MTITTLKSLDFFKNTNLLRLELLKNQGYCNTNYKLSTLNNEYLIRVFKNTQSVNISRKFEFQIQYKASLKKIAPKPFVLDLDHAFMVTEFIKGSHKDKLKHRELIKLTKTIQKYHSFKIDEKEYDIKKDFIFYKKTLRDKDSKKIIRESFRELLKLKKFNKELVLTHHDLNAKNILFHQHKITIIDWEYAGINDLFFDLASLCYEFNLSQKEQKLVLKTYFKKLTSKKIAKLNSYMIIYKNLCILWFKSLEKG